MIDARFYNSGLGVVINFDIETNRANQKGLFDCYDVFDAQTADKFGRISFICHLLFRAQQGTLEALRYWDNKREQKILTPTRPKYLTKGETVSYEDSSKFFIIL